MPKSKGIHIIIGDLLILGSIRFFERARQLWKFKGRMCYRGDSAQDESGAWAVYQELHAAQTGIHSANSKLAYGMLPGNKPRRQMPFGRTARLSERVNYQRGQRSRPFSADET